MWIWITHAFRLSCAESRGNDNVRKSRQIWRYNNQGRIQVWADSAPAPLLTTKSCKFSLFWGHISQFSLNFVTRPWILDPALITHLQMWRSIWPLAHSINTDKRGQKETWFPLLNSLVSSEKIVWLVGLLYKTIIKFFENLREIWTLFFLSFFFWHAFFFIQTLSMI